jgi:hypothetical protein
VDARDERGHDGRLAHAAMDRHRAARYKRAGDYGGAAVAFTLLVAGLLVAVTIVTHYEALRLISRLVARSVLPPRLSVLIVVMGCFAAHVVEIAFYAAAYVLIDAFGGGSLRGHLEGRLGDYLYFSATSYSTLGFGDVYPTGMLRLIAGLEAVNGLFLIAWSTSFTYLAMERLWPLHSRVRKDEE